VAFLFDTDAISEVLKRRPLPAYVAWLRTVPRVEQFTSAVVIGELFKGAYRSPDVAWRGAPAGRSRPIAPASVVVSRSRRSPQLLLMSRSLSLCI
jgi:predicted nucleic acid-binding protein